MGGKANGQILYPKEYKAWENMKSRCYNSSATGYRNYGGRGIQVSNKWRRSFWAFLRDMGMAPTPKHSVDRVDVNLDYDKHNCRWATKSEQMRNTRLNKRIDGTSLQDYAEMVGIHPKTLDRRLKLGQPLSGPVARPYGLAAASREHSIPVSTLSNRMKRTGLTLEEAVARGKKKSR